MSDKPIRKIIHVDMDAFFASIEQRDDPSLRGKPVVVGGLPHSRGVVATCSYEARKYGIHSAMPSSHAYRLCPHAVFIKPNMEKYKSVSRQVMSIFRIFTDLVEPLAMDEAYLDVTDNKWGISSATLIAQEIKKRIQAELHLTASAGVSYNKFLAKVGSGYQKPSGLTTIPPEKAMDFIDRIPIGKFFGVGAVTEKKLLDMGITNGAELRASSKETLQAMFGKKGIIFHLHASGVDERPVIPNRKRKSLGRETTLSADVTLIEDMLPILQSIAQEVSQKLKANNLVAQTISVKVKFQDFTQMTRSLSLELPTYEYDHIYNTAIELLTQLDPEQKPIRLLGISTSKLQYNNGTLRQSPYYEQLKLF